jgi:hypothetical protein
MTIGSGKTFTACNFIYRLIAYAGARRVLFLVDRRTLGRQALNEFQQFTIPSEDPRPPWINSLKSPPTSPRLTAVDSLERKVGSWRSGKVPLPCPNPDPGRLPPGGDRFSVTATTQPSDLPMYGNFSGTWIAQLLPVAQTANRGKETLYVRIAGRDALEAPLAVVGPRFSC